MVQGCTSHEKKTLLYLDESCLAFYIINTQPYKIVSKEKAVSLFSLSTLVVQ